MENRTEILAKQLIRGICESKVRRDSDERREVIHKAFRNAMLPKITRLVERRRKEIGEDFSAFLGAVGKAAAHAAADHLATGLGVSSKTITSLGSALLKPSAKSTTKLAASKPPTAKKRKTKPKSAVGNVSQTASASAPLTRQAIMKNPMSTKPQKRISHLAKLHTSLMSSSRPAPSPPTNVFTIDQIRKFKETNKDKVVKINAETEIKGDE